MATGQIDLLGFLTNILGQRQNESQFGRDLTHKTEQNALDRALEVARQAEAQRQYNASLANQQGQFGQTLANEQSQFAQNLANNQSQFGQNLGLETDKFASDKQQRELDALSKLSGLVGAGANNMGQADILSLLAGKSGLNFSPAYLLNQATVAANAAKPAGGTGAASSNLPGLGQGTWYRDVDASGRQTGQWHR